MMLLMMQHGHFVKSLLALAFALAATCCFAGSSISTAAGGGATGSASLMFKIVIPTVMILDTATSTIYSNDARMVMLVGTSVASSVQFVSDSRVNVAASGLHRVSASGHSVGRLVARKFESGDVLCAP
jgi:hypothetical protein